MGGGRGLTWQGCRIISPFRISVFVLNSFFSVFLIKHPLIKYYWLPTMCQVVLFSFGDSLLSGHL